MITVSAAFELPAMNKYAIATLCIGHLQELMYTHVLYWALVMDSALFLGSHTVWNHPSLSVRSYVWLPKKSLCACTKLAGRRARLMLSK